MTFSSVFSVVKAPSQAEASYGLLGTLVRCFFNQAAEGDWNGARASLTQLFEMRGKFASLATLREIVDNKISVRSYGAVFGLGVCELPAAMQSAFEEAIGKVSEFLQCAPPLIFVMQVDDPTGVHLTIGSFPGFALIRLANSGETTPENGRLAIFHETGHAFLWCGVRTLDEGLACLVADRYSGVSIAGNTETVRLSLRTLLAKASDRGLFFEGSGAAFSEVDAIRRLGARLVESVHARHGAAGLKKLFFEISQSSVDDEVVHLIEEALGESVERFHTTGSATFIDTDVCIRARSTMFSAYRANDYRLLDTIIVELESRRGTQAPEVLDWLIRTRLMRALIQLDANIAVSPEDLARIDLLMGEARTIPPARLWTLRGHRAMLAIKIEQGNFVKVALYHPKAVKAYQQAMLLTPQDTDLRIGQALLLMKTPEKYGGDPETGRRMLNAMCSDPVYGAHILDILTKFPMIMNEPRTDPSIAARGESGPLATLQTAALTMDLQRPAISIRGLSNRLSDDFSLEITELDIARDERVAFVGRNGSGKTVLLETLLGLRQAQRGIVGYRISAGLAETRVLPKSDLGALLQNVGFFGNTYISQLIRLHRVMYRKVNPIVTDALGMSELVNKKYVELSRGQEQRVLLYLALAHDPSLVFLDEPTLGLDEWFAQSLRGLWRAENQTLLIISHVAADIEKMDRIVCLNEGKIFDTGKLDDLVERYAGKFKAKTFQELSPQAIDQLKALPGLTRPPEYKEKSWIMFGDPVFRKEFQNLMLAHDVAAFSTEHAGTEDFLSRIAKA